jgi:hypothetical protein
MEGLIPWLFAAMMVVGVLYLLLNIMFGGFSDADLPTHNLHGLFDFISGGDTAVDGQGVGCSAIAAFLAGFGSVGLFGTLARWNLLISVIVALVAGLLMGRVVVSVLRFVARQESTAVITSADLVGSIARVTVNTPAGKLGEAMLEDGQRIKYAVKEISNLPLQRGDFVEVVEVKEGRLLVKKKRMEEGETS